MNYKCNFLNKYITQQAQEKKPVLKKKFGSQKHKLLKHLKNEDKMIDESSLMFWGFVFGENKFK